MRQSAHKLEISTRGQGLYECTSTIDEWVRRQKMQTGLLTVFCRHTSASLLIQENADPTVRHDIKAYFDHLAPEDGPYEHDSEGPDDMPVGNHWLQIIGVREALLVGSSRQRSRKLATSAREIVSVKP